MKTPIHDKIEKCERGDYPFAIAKLASGWVCLAETQPLQGYCILFSNPVVSDLNALDLGGRAAWGVDCARVGDALIKALGAIRVNYETWGNQDPALHTHITPRFANEPADKRTLPPRQAYDWSAPATDLHSPAVQELIAKLRSVL